MENDDLYSFLNSLSSTTIDDSNNVSSGQSEQNNSGYSSNFDYGNQQNSNTNTGATYSPYSTSKSDTSYNPYSSAYDDYSVTPNFEGEQSYNPQMGGFSDGVTDFRTNQTDFRTTQTMEMPLIQKDETPVVNMVKTRQKIELQARMKIVVTMFTIIMSLLVFVTAYNFISASKLRATFAGKEQEITALRNSISVLSEEYNITTGGGDFVELAKNNGYVEVSDKNTTVINLGEFHEEQSIEQLPSNWFNDVCDFLSNLFR